MNQLILQGILYDEKSSYQRGPKQAPPEIRKALHGNSANAYAENLTSIEDLSIVDKGDFEINDYFEIEALTARLLQSNTKLLSLGGDHSITFPIIKAYHTHFPKLDILHIDAHSDLYDKFEGDRHSHACPFARIMEHGFADRLVQVGIRTLTAHQNEQAIKYGVEVHQMKDLDTFSIPSFRNPLYISLDMDAFDPAYAPGVSHYEPGGLTARFVINLIQNLDAQIVGADIVEYNPTKDHHDMTAFLAAKMLKELLVKMA